MAVLSNKEILALAKDDPSYKRFTSYLTDSIFTTKGFESFAYANAQELADFFNMSVRIILQKILRPNPRIPSSYKSVVEEYSNPEGGMFQRINTNIMKPTSPKYRNLVNGGSVDPFIVRKPTTSERFFKQNWDFANLLTIQDIDLKKMFLQPNGISEYVAGIMATLDDSYAIQKYEVFREMINKILTSTNHALKDSQKIQIDAITQASTNADMAKFLQVFHNFKSMMDTACYSAKFNADSFEHGLYPEDYVLLVRADIMNQIRTTLMATSYHTDTLTIPFKVEEVKDFGGITYRLVSDHSTAVLPIYDTFGACIGFNTTGSGTPLTEDEIEPVDPNETVDAILMQKGVIFTTQQMPYETRAIYNPAGRYTNFWASQPNGSFNYDACYDVVKFYHTT